MANGGNGRQGVKITIIAEGKTEKVFLNHLREFLSTRLAGRMPTLAPNVYNGRIPTGEKLRRRVTELLRHPSDHVIALTDVYTGTTPPDFEDAADAKSKMSGWVGQEPRFHPHAAQYEIEAWLLPYWPRIRELARHNQSAPKGDPESINHSSPPTSRLKEVFRRGRGRHSYVKTRDFGKILEGQDLSVAIDCCPELKAMVNTILSVCGGQTIP